MPKGNDEGAETGDLFFGPSINTVEYIAAGLIKNRLYRLLNFHLKTFKSVYLGMTSDQAKELDSCRKQIAALIDQLGQFNALE